MSNSIGLAAPGFIEHGFSVFSVLWFNTSQATLVDLSPYTCRPCLHRPSRLSSATNRRVCDRFDTGHDPQYMTIPSELPTVKDQCNIPNAEFLSGVTSLSLVSQIPRITVLSLWQSLCSSGLFGHHVSLMWSIIKWTQYLAAMALSQPPSEHIVSPRLQKVDSASIMVTPIAQWNHCTSVDSELLLSMQDVHTLSAEMHSSWMAAMSIKSSE